MFFTIRLLHYTDSFIIYLGQNTWNASLPWHKMYDGGQFHFSSHLVGRSIGNGLSGIERIGRNPVRRWITTTNSNCSNLFEKKMRFFFAARSLFVYDPWPFRIIKLKKIRSNIVFNLVGITFWTDSKAPPTDFPNKTCSFRVWMQNLDLLSVYLTESISKPFFRITKSNDGKEKTQSNKSKKHTNHVNKKIDRFLLFPFVPFHLHMVFKYSRLDCDLIVRLLE